MLVYGFRRHSLSPATGEPGQCSRENLKHGNEYTCLRSLLGTLLLTSCREEVLEFAIGGDLAEKDQEQIDFEAWDYHWVNTPGNLTW